MGLGGADERAKPTLHQQLEFTNELLHTFFEWRHKVLVRFFVAAGAALTGMGLVVDRELPGWLILFPAALGATASYMSFKMDAVNTYFMKLAYEQGADVEEELGVSHVGLFTKLQKAPPRDGGGLHFFPWLHKNEPDVAGDPKATELIDADGVDPEAEGRADDADVPRPSYRRVLRWTYRLAFYLFVVAGSLLAAIDLSSSS